MAYMSSAKEELMDAIDMFLGDSIVLPPGDWDQDLILPLMHERNELKKRKGKDNNYVCTSTYMTLSIIIREKIGRQFI